MRASAVAAIAALSFGAGYLVSQYQSLQRPSPPLDRSSALEKPAGAHAPLATRTEAQAHTAPSPQQRNEAPLALPETDATTDIRTLLDQGQYQDAVERYAQSESPELRAVFLAHLDALSDHSQRDAFQSLAEAWLGYYYTDTEWRLRVARYQAELGWQDQAAQSFEYAWQYAHSDAERNEARSSFQRFVVDTDRRLSESEEWEALLAFYADIREMEVNVAEHRFREAEWLLSLNERARAEQLLAQLAQEPQYAARVEALLARASTEQPQSQQQRPEGSTLWDSEIAMQAHGAHFLLDVRLNQDDTIQLMLDTGASITSLSTDAFNALDTRHDFEWLGQSQFSTAGGIVVADVYRATSLALGPYQFESVDIAVVPIPANAHYGGVLGMNILRQFEFQIDQHYALLKLNPQSTPR